jgi:hypothetical protein
MKLLAIAAVTGCALAQTVDLDQILSRVADNQAAAQELRKQFTYRQKQLLRLTRGNGKLAREERREYDVTPEPQSFKKALVKFEGKYERNGKYIRYDKPGYEYKDVDLDSGLIDSLSEGFTNSKASRDGIRNDRFPLTAREQKKYSFRLEGAETYRGRRVYRIAFGPKPDAQEVTWKGEALIDAEECQPVLVSTRMAFKVPLLVKALLGTDIHGLGFSVAYQKFADGLWFPVSYGGEFAVRAAFVYKRKISVSLENCDFRRTDVSSNIEYQTVE